MGHPIRALAIFASAAALAVAPASGAAAYVDQPPPEIEYTYEVRTRGHVSSDVDEFARHAAETFADVRGWSLGGEIAYRRVGDGGDFTLWLASPEEVGDWAPGCSEQWSCRVGRDVIINDDRWQNGSPGWDGPLDQYRHYVVSHELGHWHGLSRWACPQTGGEGPVMMQQSKGPQPCRHNTWPTIPERDAVADGQGVEVRRNFPLGSVWPHADMSGHPDGDGSWLAHREGDVSTSPDARHHGDASDIALAAPIVGLAPTPTGNGYWLVATDGGVFSFGDATFHGSAADIDKVRPVVGIAPSRTGNGYWLVAADGGVFSFGDAAFHGSAASIDLARPVTGIARSGNGNGYWLVAADGGVFSFGDAAFRGSAGSIDQDGDVADITRTPGGDGYWLVATDGGVFSFGDATFQGSAADDQPTGVEYAAIAAHPGGGYWLLDADGVVKPYGDATAHGKP